MSSLSHIYIFIVVICLPYIYIYTHIFHVCGSRDEGDLSSFCSTKTQTAQRQQEAKRHVFLESGRFGRFI